MDKIHSIKKRILKLREDVESEFLSDNINEQKLLELSTKLDKLILLYMKAKKASRE